jgi:S1-C subfamily serine protease
MMHHRAVGIVRQTALPVLLAVSVSCAYTYRVPTGLRERSAAALADTWIEGTPFLDFMKARSAFVALHVKTEPGKGVNGLTRVSWIWKGTSAAIDRRGYFLTAAHVASESPVHLFLDDHFVEARIVWRGQLETGGTDLALLHVPSTRERVFAWAPGVTRDENVVGAGPTRVVKSAREDEVRFELSLYGGAVLGTSPGRTKETVSVIRSSTPIGGGDSGGPLVNERGQLLGINVRSSVTMETLRVWRLFRKEYAGEALRPDITWLTKVIADDAREREALKGKPAS